MSETLLKITDALRVSELQFTNAFEHGPIGLALVSLTGGWLRVNRSLVQMLGYSEEEFLNKSFYNITYHEDLNVHVDDQRRLLSGDIQMFQKEKRYVHKLGQIVWAHISVSLFRDSSGNPVHYITQIQNITERKLAEVALREKDGIFRILSETMPQMIWMTLPDGQNIYLNQQWIDYTGLTLEQSAGHAWITPFHPDEQQLAQRAWMHAADTGGEYSLECRLRRFDGTYHWWLIRGLPLRDGAGQIIKWVGTCTDIDKLKRALESAKASEEKIAEQAAVIEQAQDAILLKDLDDRILFWNQGAEKLYGWSSAQAMGRKSSELHDEESDKYMEARSQMLLHGHWEGELLQRTRKGTEVISESRWTLTRDAAGRAKAILVIGTDITEKKKIQAHFLRSQRMESIGTLAGGIAHDLNNVLAPIMMSIELLKIGEQDKDRLATLETIDTCSQRGASMVSQVLSFARGIDGQRHELHPKHLLRDVEKIAGDTFLKSVQIKNFTATDLWSISGDATQLHQVLLNLCVNARDAMPHGGNLTLTANNVNLNKSDAAFNGDVSPGCYVVLGIEDSGTGISREVQDRMFEPFFTTKGLGKGTGLGLSTSLAIVKSHGGFIRVYSEPGKGTKFKVYLPAQDKSAAESELTLSRQLPRGGGELILVVDDEDSVRQITRQTLEAFGYRVCVANGGTEALAIYALRRQEIALVLTDMMMPLMDGPTTIQEIRKLNPHVLIIAASGLNSNAGIVDAEHFLPKPFTTETLLKALRKALHG